ncbi:MAG: filamentous hemagglutinin N-terminal domain-containing protein, partial [Chlorobiaceae bacterium]|nr:filamentous hemagglutinin N-terminal domain-containing protein [Chlorobiaceae bacterium]
MRHSFHSARILPYMRKPLISMVSATAMLFFYPMFAFTAPTSGVTVKGSAIISQSGTTTTIDQGSARAVIDWGGFSINSNELVMFNQPNSSAAVLNRVKGGDPTTILGQLSANGRVFIANPNGIVFGAGSKIDVAGLVATTLSISNDDFMSGHNLFSQDLSKANSYVVNQGEIHVADNGFCFLVAPGVSNKGTIVAQLGKVVMASGKELTLDFNGDGLMTYTVSGKVLDSVIGPDGQPMSSGVANSGTVTAKGGDVVLVGNASGNVFSSVVNNSGIIEATALNVEGGSVVLSGGDEGITANTGTIDVSGKLAGQKGGKVEVLGDKVGLFDGTRIDASGDAGGGTVLIGGDYQGKNPEVQNASRTFVGSDAKINADATGNGDGGKVIVWSNDGTKFFGNISARGGELGGNGGFAEVSGKAALDFNGSADLRAPQGSVGTLLLDPLDMYIGGILDVDWYLYQTGPYNYYFIPFPDLLYPNGVLLPGTLVSQLSLGNVLVTTGELGTSGSGDITVASSINWIGGYKLTLSAYRDIIINNGVDIQNNGIGGMALNAGGSVSIGGNLATFGDVAVTAGGGIGQAAAAVIMGNKVTLNSMFIIGGGGYFNTMATNLDVTTTSPFFGVDISNTFSTLTDLTLRVNQADVHVLQTGVNVFDFVAASSTLTSSGLTNLTFSNTGGGVTLAGATYVGNALNVYAYGGSISQSPGASVIVGGPTTLYARSGGSPSDINLFSPSNNFQGAVYSDGANVTLVDGVGGLILGTTIAAGDLVATSTGGALTTSGNISTTGGGSIFLSTTGAGNGITLSNTVTANGAGNVTLNADAGTVAINAGVSSTSGDIVVTGDAVTQGVNITTGTVGPNIGTVSVTADNGSITMADLTKSQTDSGAIVYNATGDVALSQLNSTSGAINVTADSDTNGAGKITDILTNGSGGEGGSNIITSGTATLSAATGIGTSVFDEDIDTTIGTLVASNSTSGVIYVQESSGLSIGGAGVQTLGGSGNIHIDVAAGDLDVNSGVTAQGSGSITLTAAGSITQNADITTGSVGTDSGAVSVAAFGGNLTMIDGKKTTSQSGSITNRATGDVALSQLISTSGAINVTADSDTNGAGQITDILTNGIGGEGASNLITSGTVTLSAATGIGSSAVDADIDTTIGTLVATNSTSGDIYVQESNGLSIGGTGVRTLAGNGNINIDVDAGGLLVGSVVTAHGSGNVTLNADAGMVAINAAVSSTSGDIVVTGDAVTQDSNITTGTVGIDVGTVSVTADNGSITMGNLSTTQTNSGSIVYGATQNVGLSLLTSTTGTIDVTAGSGGSVLGEITDQTTLENANLVTTGQVTLTAETGIGASGTADIDTNIDLVQATNNTSGDIYLQELAATNGFTINGTGVRTLAGNGNINIDVDAGNLTVNSVVTAHGYGNVTLNADGGLIDINAVVSSTSGDIVVTGDAVTQDSNITTGTVGPDIGTVVVTADNGSITMADGTATSTNTGTIDYSATGSVALSLLTSTSGDIGVTAGSGGSVVGAITDNTAPGEGANLVTSGTATLTAETGIGAAGAPDIDTTIGTLVATNNTSGDIYVQESSGLIIGGTGVRTLGGNGNINIDVDAGNLTVNSVVTAHGYGNVTLNADAGLIDINAVVSSTSGDIVVMGDAVTQDSNITTGTVGSDVGTVQVIADNGSITMADLTTTSTSTGTIDYTATGNVALSLLTSTSGNIGVTAGSGGSVVGAITDNTALENANLVTSGTATLTAETGIGAAGAPDIDTTIGTLVATNNTSGDIYVQETNGLIIGGTGVRTLGGNGNINIDVDAGNLTVNSVVTAHGYGNVTL